MGCSARAITRSPEYGVNCLSASVKGALHDYLEEEGCEIYFSAEDDVWTMDIDDCLRDAVLRLHESPDVFEGLLPADLRGRWYAYDAWHMLREGIEGMDFEGTNTLTIEWE